MTNGIIYYNKGFSCIPRLLVSLFTLRQHTNMDVTVFMEGKDLEKLSNDLAQELKINIIYDSNPDTTTYVRAVEVCMRSPYDNTMWIDADTTIHNNFDEIFNFIPENDICIPHFIGWVTQGSGIKKRINRFKNLIDNNMIENAINFGPAINCGVYGFSKNREFLEEWLKISKIGEKNRIFIPDEVACQILLPKYKTKILDKKYNVSVKFGSDVIDPVIIHYHGRKHCRSFALSEIWIKQFINLIEQDFCSIKKYVEYDRTLKKFLNYKYKYNDLVDKCNTILCSKIPKNNNKDTKQTNIDSDVTIVTACDPRYVECLKLTLPTWIKYKNILNYPMIVYVNGFKDNDTRLDFLRQHNNIRIIHWDMHNVDNHREKMLSAFVFGPAKDVETKYWLKIDSDAYAINNNRIFNNDMINYDIVGHKWGYTKPFKWIDELNMWSKNIQLNFQHNIVKEKINKNRYYHHRTNSFVQLHSTEFTKLAAKLAKNRLPVPSQDTYLWYVSEALGKNVKRYNFKRNCGIFNKRNAQQIKTTLASLNDQNKIINTENSGLLRLNVGCGKRNFPGWINTNKDQLDITKTQSWQDNKIISKSVDIILAEHVFQCLSDEDRRLSIENFKNFIKDTGVIRIAVPDGFNPNKNYIDQVKVGGIGKSAGNNKYLYNYITLTQLFEEYGFQYNLLEYFNEDKNFIFNEWSKEDGFIKRSSRFDKRNKKQKLSYTSLIIDFMLIKSN